MNKNVFIQSVFLNSPRYVWLETPLQLRRLEWHFCVDFPWLALGRVSKSASHEVGPPWIISGLKMHFALTIGSIYTAYYSKVPRMQFRRLRLHFCVAFPWLSTGVCRPVLAENSPLDCFQGARTHQACGKVPWIATWSPRTCTCCLIETHSNQPGKILIYRAVDEVSPK